MSSFIVNPPIRSDADYYRADDDVVQRILDGESMLVPGLRRAGKTSFLLRVGRAATAAKRKSLFFDLYDFFITRRFAKEVPAVANEIRASDNAIILLDEAEVFRNEQKYLKQLLSACRDHTFVMTCAPVFILELDKYSDWIQARVEQLHRHLLGPLSWEEALNLLSQSKRPRPVTLEKDVIEEIRRSGDRLPIILQALGAKHVDGSNLYGSLAQFGTRVLMGLTPKAREAFVLAAHGGKPAPNSTEVKLLTALGGLRNDKGNGRVTIAGKILDNVIRESSEPPPIEGKARRAVLPAAEWIPYATILHLSDLHFGPHCIEMNAAESQFGRLRSALERDHVSPDFVVVTGDLSWSGHRDELKDAEKFLELLSKWLSKSRRWTDKQTRKRILLLPGNHEAAWALTNGLNEEERATWSCYSLAPFASLVHRFHRGDVFWDVERACDKRCFDEPSLAFVSISTSHLITQESKRGQFGDMVRNEVVALLDQKDVRQARFRIGLMHHNLRAFQKDGQVLLDGESAWLHFAKCKPGLDFVLHGHVHQGEVNFFAPREGAAIQYSAVGSFGVRATHRPGDDLVGRVPNEFSIVCPETNGTGRRFTTQFYELTHTPTGDWEWRSAKRTSSKSL